jgi:hypothetical protein
MDLERYDVSVNAMMPVAMTRLAEAMPDEVLDELPDDQMEPEQVAALPAALLSAETADVTGWTFGIAGDTVYTVSNPQLDRSAIAATARDEGVWRAVGVALLVAFLARVLVGGVPPGPTFGALVGVTSAGAAWSGYRGRKVVPVLAVAAAPFSGIGLFELAGGDVAGGDRLHDRRLRHRRRRLRGGRRLAVDPR